MFTLKYNHAISLITIMTSAKLSGVRNIQRGRCLRLLKSEAELFETERKRMLVEEHAVCSEDGKPIETEGGGYQIKNGMAWNDAIMKLVNDAPIKLEIKTDADKGWVKLCKEVMTTALCPEITGDPAQDFDYILEALSAADVETKTE